jgi:hypothetical protein
MKNTSKRIKGNKELKEREFKIITVRIKVGIIKGGIKKKKNGVLETRIWGLS